MNKIKISRNVLGDTRTATRVPTFYEMVDSNRNHINDVAEMMREIAEDIKSAGINHDKTKTNDPYKSMFYRELCATIEGKMDNFTNGEWYPMHCKRHRSKEWRLSLSAAVRSNRFRLN